MKENVLITGITGQDGYYLAKNHLDRGDNVYGLVRRSSIDNKIKLKHLKDIKYITGDITDKHSLQKAVEESRPSRVYNLAAQSHVGDSWKVPDYTYRSTAIGAANMLDVIKEFSPTTKFYQASSSELFGNSPAPQNETTPFYPRSPYAVSKLFAHTITINYRESYNLWACCGILFNHTSPLRQDIFVEKKIVSSAVRIKLGLQKKLKLGNLNSCRDIGHADDYTKAMILMLDQINPKEFVIATGETHSIKEIVEKVFVMLEMNYLDFLEIDTSLKRPAEVNLLQGNPEKAIKKLQWTPEYSFDSILEEMITHEYNKYTLK